MFEVQVQTPTHVRLRIGRWHFRTWHPRPMDLPKGYRSPEFVYSVEEYDDEGRSLGQLATFFDQREAQACLATLEAEGRSGLELNMNPVHIRASDWEFDR